jgi:heme/copper-type cytochrome/quinol oxidase subunit 3
MTDITKKGVGMSDTPEEREYELRAHIGAIWTGGRLFIGIYTFLIASLAFSYFYLRSSNNGLLWRPDHVTAPSTYGWSIWALTMLAVVMAIFGQSRLRKGSVGDWRLAIWVGVGASVLALFLQIWEYQKLNFYPGSSGYASTFIGYSVINIMTLVIVAYWLETSVARSLLMRKQLSGESPETSMLATGQSFRANVASMTYFLGFVALACTLMFAMFYLL